MVSGVQNNVGASAYSKSSQLGSPGARDSSANFKKDVAAGTESPSAAPADEVKKAARPEETTKTEDRQPEKNQLEAKNDNQTLQNEQTRGSLLDIAV